MVNTNHGTASAIDCIRKIQELTDSKLIKCEKLCDGDRFPSFDFSATDDEGYDCALDIYYDGKAGWKVSTYCMDLNYKALADGVVPFLRILNYCQPIKYEDIRKEFGIEEEGIRWSRSIEEEDK